MMNSDPTQAHLYGLVNELCKLPTETPWLEFKHNYATPEDVGEYISAMSNMAALHGKAAGYILWGIENATHRVVGTNFHPAKTKKGNEDLENWLTRLLTPRIHFRFYEVTYEGLPVVVLEVPRAQGQPVQFQGVEYIRVGTCRQKLKDHPQIERDLWRVFDATPFENLIALEHADVDTVLSVLDYPAFFELLSQPLPENRELILERLKSEGMIVADTAGKWSITSLGGILLAKDLDSFKTLSRKAVRVILYDGKNRLNTIREQRFKKGYAVGFVGLIEFINTLMPRNEVIGHALRKEVRIVPELALREIIANALIHQDFSITGTGPMIEIFADRIEVTNPGQPLIDTERFLDSPPRSRNEILASFMRRVNICEERGTGVDKVVSQTEMFQLPAPLFETPPESTRIVLFSRRNLSEMDRADRTRACYLHACLRYVERNPMTNSSLRERFGITEKNSSMASRIIKDAIEDGFVKPFDAQQGRKYAKYIPFWA
jgi:predicted HTH transcriptional regulator